MCVFVCVEGGGERGIRNGFCTNVQSFFPTSSCVQFLNSFCRSETLEAVYIAYD